MVNTLSFLPIPLLQWYGEHARDAALAAGPDPLSGVGVGDHAAADPGGGGAGATTAAFWRRPPTVPGLGGLPRRIG